MSERPAPQARSDYRQFSTLDTRWMDNDAYGHLNNVVYYSLFDTAVNRYLIEAGALDIHRSEVIGLVVETHCNYFAPIEFPQRVDAGLRVAHRGSSSVRYEIGLFAAGAALRQIVLATRRQGVPIDDSLGQSGQGHVRLGFLVERRLDGEGLVGTGLGCQQSDDQRGTGDPKLGQAVDDSPQHGRERDRGDRVQRCAIPPLRGLQHRRMSHARAAGRGSPSPWWPTSIR